jgi:hypothetical protein
MQLNRQERFEIGVVVESLVVVVARGDDAG